MASDFPKPKDFLGNPIDGGDTIVYPGRQGSNLWMNKATVISVSGPHPMPNGRVEYTLNVLRSLDGRKAQVKKTGNVVVVEKQKNAKV